MNRGFLLTTSSRESKIHAVESQITLVVWRCLSLTEKQHKINRMIIFNDSVSKFYQCNIWGLCWGKSMVFSICFGQKKKKTEQAIKFLGILTKNIVSMNKIYFCWEEKSDVSVNKKVIFDFHTIFKLDFITQIIYCIIHRCMYSLFIYLLFSYITF